jgi:beta-galactosidase/beta-glucuronidase
MALIDPAYPRPDFVRRDWLSLNGTWEYSFVETAQPEEVSWQGTIRVPYPPEAPLSGVDDPAFHPVVWYRRKFTVPSIWRNQKLRLNFGAVDYFAQVWVNGHLVAEHEGGHTPFSAEISGTLLDDVQTLVVRAFDEPSDMEKPRGKQDWQLEPHAIWYPRTSGIWQPVWLEPISQASIAHIHLIPDVQRFEIQMEVDFEAPGDTFSAGYALEVKLNLDENELASESWEIKQPRARFRLPVFRPKTAAAREALLWRPENPVLFDLTLTLRAAGVILDRVESYVALREISTCDGQFFLNGKPYFLQMVLDQGYWPESHLAAPDPEALRRDVELTKALGFNGVRKHQKIEDPRYLYWADRLGLLVWGELPSAYRFSMESIRRLTLELISMIERDYNHPSLVAWVPFNESWGIPDVPRSDSQRYLSQSLYTLAKALDPTRLVVDNDGWEHGDTDLFTVHDYENKPDLYAWRYGTPEGFQAALNRQDVEHHLALPGYIPNGQPVILSEFGGMRLGMGKGWGYQQVESEEEFLSRLYPLMLSAFGKRLAGFCYTQLTDTFQEQNGLLYADRRPKVDPKLIAEIQREGLRQRQEG